MSEEFAPFQLHFVCSSEGERFFFSLPKKREVTLKLPFLFFLRTALGPLYTIIIYIFLKILLFCKILYLVFLFCFFFGP